MGQVRVIERGVFTAGAVDQLVTLFCRQALEGGQEHLDLVCRSAGRPDGNRVARPTGYLAPLLIAQGLSFGASEAGFELEQQLGNSPLGKYGQREFVRLARRCCYLVHDFLFGRLYDAHTALESGRLTHAPAIVGP